MWLRLVPAHSQAYFLSLDLTEWLLQNLVNKLDIPRYGNWVCFFRYSNLEALFFQNQFIFGGTKRQRDILDDIRSHMFELMAAKNALDFIKIGTNKIECWIAWTELNDNAIKLNTDGAFSSVNGNARAGELVRDSLGRWIGGFMVNIGYCLVTKAELWVVYHVLLLAWDKGFRNLEVEMDSMLAFLCITGSHEEINANTTIIRDIKRLLTCKWQVTIKHIYRETNRAADFLASHAQHFSFGYYRLDAPPTAQHSILFDDYRGIAFHHDVLV